MQQQVEGDRAEAEPDRPVRREERDHRVLQADARVTVERSSSATWTTTKPIASSVRFRCRPAVTKRGQRAERQRTVVSTPRATDAVRSSSAPDAEPARQEPERLAAGGREDHATRASSGQPPTRTTDPSWRTARRGQAPARRASAGAASPSTTAAVAAMLASAQDAAATLTWRHGVSAGRPERGSRMWWASPLVGPPAADGRARRGEAAARDRDHGARAGERGGVIVGDAHRPAAGGGGPATATSPPRQTRAPEPVADAIRCGGPVGGPRLRRRAEVELDARRDEQRPLLVVELDVPPGPAPRAAIGADAPRLTLAHEREGPVVARRPELRAERRIDEPVRAARRIERDAHAPARAAR